MLPQRRQIANADWRYRNPVWKTDAVVAQILETGRHIESFFDALSRVAPELLIPQIRFGQRHNKPTEHLAVIKAAKTDADLVDSLFEFHEYLSGQEVFGAPPSAAMLVPIRAAWKVAVHMDRPHLSDDRISHATAMLADRVSDVIHISPEEKDGVSSSREDRLIEFYEAVADIRGYLDAAYADNPNNQACIDSRARLASVEALVGIGHDYLVSEAAQREYYARLMRCVEPFMEGVSPHVEYECRFESAGVAWINGNLQLGIRLNLKAFEAARRIPFEMFDTGYLFNLQSELSTTEEAAYEVEDFESASRAASMYAEVQVIYAAQRFHSTPHGVRLAAQRSPLGIRMLDEIDATLDRADGWLAIDRTMRRRASSGALEMKVVGER